MRKRSLKKRIVSWIIVASILSAVISMLPSVKAVATETLQEDEKLLYGYNVTSGKNLMEPDALQTAFPIIDPKSDYLSHVKKIEGTSQSSQNYMSTSLSEVAEDFARNISAEAFGRIYVVDADVSSSFDLTKHVDNVYSEKYELYTTSISRYHYVVQLSTEQIRTYLADQFELELKAVKSKADAKKLYEKYGTHLNTGYMLGGRMNITNYMTTSDTSVDLSRGVALKEKVSAVISKVQVGESASIVEQYSSLENDKTSTSTYKFESFGGEATSSLTLDGLFTYNASYVDGNNAGFMYTRWINSINEDKNLSIIGIPNSAKSIPLWDLLDSSSENYDARQVLVDTYIEMCGDKYNEFLSTYPELVRESEAKNEENSILPTVNGAYIRTPNGFFYYVDQSDFSSSGAHNGVHKDEYLYLDLQAYSNSTGIDYDCQNCEKLDRQSAVFKVTGTSGNVIITILCGGKKQDILKVPVLPTICEGGMGNETYPFIMTSSAHFSAIPKNNSSYYTLYNDIDFKGTTVSCLGNFKGCLDGNYCTISNFTIETNKDWGLFSKNEGTIENLCIKNAGSSRNLSGFQNGGTNYSTDYAEDKYTNNAISALNAGIVCASNTGNIENCYITGGFIRNIIKNDTNWFVNSAITINTGVISGTNSGSISDCMVKDCSILGSVVNTSENTYSINVFSGGLIGQFLMNGSISSCVVDMGTSSTIMSQVVNYYSKKNADATVQSFSGGIAGYSNTAFSMNNNFVYVRNASGLYKAVDAEFISSNKGVFGLSWFLPSEYNPKKYHALKDAVIVCGDNSTLTSKDNSSYSVDSAIPSTCIKPSSKNGTNSEKDKDCYVEVNPITENKVDSQAKFNQLGLTESSFSYDGTAGSTSHVRHILSANRSSYIKLSVDKTDSSLNASFYDGAMFNPKGIELSKEVNIEVKPAKVFNLKVLKNDSVDVTDSKLVFDASSRYKVKPSLYAGEVADKQGIDLIISDNEIESISVIEDKDLYHIFYDERETYVNTWNASKIKLQAIKTNGEAELIENMADSEVSIVTRPENIIRGDNVITLKYCHDGKTYESTYILKVDERKVKSITIASKPTVTTYTVGETVKLDGLEVDVNYEVGESTRLKGEDLDRLEVLGKNIVEGKNIVTLLYDGYDYTTSFEVEGVKTEQNDSSNEHGNPIDLVNGKRPIALVVILIAVIIVGGGSVLFVATRSKKKNKEKNAKE